MHEDGVIKASPEGVPSRVPETLAHGRNPILLCCCTVAADNLALGCIARASAAFVVAGACWGEAQLNVSFR